MPVDSARPAPRYRLTLFAFFLSGSAALLYQVVWQRWLVFFTGISSASISLIVAVFMAGLGIGYLAGGAWADRLRAPRPLLLFVMAELGIALFGLCSKAIIYDGLYASGVVRSTDPVKTSLILLAVLFVPTFLMGLSLPLLSKSVVLESTERQAAFVGRLYFVNTLGAAAGALLTGLFLVPSIGFQHATYVGAGLNCACALLGALLYRQQKRQDAALRDADVLQEKMAPPARFVWTRGFMIWLVQYAIAGFAAIALELAWFRVLENTIKSVSQTFSIILAFYLLFLALGTQFGNRFEKMSHERRARLFLICQYMLYLWMAGAVALLFHNLKLAGPLDFLTNYFREYTQTWDPWIVLATYGIIPAFLMAAPTFLMGMSFTLSQHLVQDSQEELGRKVGWLQFSNIIGCVAATWFVPFVGFDRIGTTGLFQIIALFGVIYAVLLAWRLPWRWVAVVLLLGALGLAVQRIPTNDRFWTVLGGLDHPEERFLNENETGIAMIKLRRMGKPASTFFCNGMGQSRLPFGRDLIHIRLGVIPTLLHPNPKDIAVIGFGAGSTVYGIGCQPDTEHITCFEVMSNQPTVLREFGRKFHVTAVPSLLEDKRFKFRFQDGREALQNEPQKYDVIEADPPYPSRGFAGNLYSLEYFQLLKSRLKPGGYAVSWDPPSTHVRETFCAVFPYAYEAGGYILIGSEKPLVVEEKKVDERMADPFSVKRLAEANIDMEGVTFGDLLKPRPLQEGKVTPPKDFDTDMAPRDEFTSPFTVLKTIWETGALPKLNQ